MISLINIVFLILIFFLIAAIIRPFQAKDIVLAKSTATDRYSRLAHTLIIDKTGNLTVNGKPASTDTLIEALSSADQTSETDEKRHRLNIIADQNLPVGVLLEHLKTMQTLKFKSIKLVTEKAKQ